MLAYNHNDHALKVKFFAIRILLVISVLIYVVSWSYITISRFYSLNSLIYDLGLYMERSWEIWNVPMGASQYIFILFQSGIIYLVFPLSLPQSYPLLLVVQSFLIGVCAIPVFYISNYFIKDDYSSLFISLSLLIYFPLAGVNWYDLHYQVYFIPLFLFAFYFYVKDKWVISFILMILSGLVRYPYIAFPLLFSLVYLLDTFYLKYKKEIISTGKIKFLVSLLIFSSAFLALSQLFLETHGLVLAGDIHASSFQPLTININNKVTTVILYLMPFLFFPLFSRRSLPLLLPYFSLMFITNFFGYVYPTSIMFQYSTAVVPFIFIGTIESISKLSRISESKRPSEINSPYRKKLPRLISIIVLIMVIILALFYEPYGPLNSSTEANFNLENSLHPNYSEYNDLVRIVSLIPENDPNILTQYNLPEIVPRELGPNPFFYITAVTLPYNLSYEQPNGNWIAANITYVLADYNSSFYYFSQAYPFNYSMSSVISRLETSGDFGVLAESGPFILLKRDYNGLPLIYNPVKIYRSSSDLRYFNGPFLVHNGTAFANYSHTQLPLVIQLDSFEHYDFVLYPGVYNFTIKLKTSLAIYTTMLYLEYFR